MSQSASLALTLALGAAVATASSAGCAHYPINAPLAKIDAGAGYRFDALAAGDNSDEVFVCLAFSGGGTRAAAFAYGVLEALRDTPIEVGGKKKRLLDEVDCISSVSGGSFTAAYYGLFGDRVFQDLEPRFLRRNIDAVLARRVFNPVNWFRLGSPWFGRIDLAAEIYDRDIFDKATFADLARRGRPYLLINGTNLEDGDRFEFTQDQFDFLGSDLTPYPVARAVAASSAFPFLLTPISLVNHPTPLLSPGPVYLNAAHDYRENPRLYRWSRNQLRYLDKPSRPYVHLMDGGLMDNMGVKGIEMQIRRSDGFIRTRLNNGRIKRLVIIIANARVADKDNPSLKESPPGLLTVAYKTATVAMENHSFDTIELMNDVVQASERAERVIAACDRKLRAACPSAPPLPPSSMNFTGSVIELNFDLVKDADRRRALLEVPTDFTIKPEQVNALIEAGRSLLGESPEFQQLARELAPAPPGN